MVVTRLVRERTFFTSILKEESGRILDSFRALYVKNARIYQPVLEAGLPTAMAEVKGLAAIFQRYGISRSSRMLDASCGIGRHSINSQSWALKW
ncbi:MAG: hypothetical protein ACREBS_06070 [Nitrososphaerales archaeon]